MQLNDYEKEHIRKLRPYLSECCVLLRSNGDFPIQNPCEIALYGSGVRVTIKGGTGSGEVNSRYYNTVEKGFRKAGFTITTKSWLGAYEKVVEEAKVQFKKDLGKRAKENHTNIIMSAQWNSHIREKRFVRRYFTLRVWISGICYDRLGYQRWNDSQRCKIPGTTSCKSSGSRK